MRLDRGKREMPTLLPAPRILAEGFAMVESARWHEDRLWLAHWGAGEVMAIDLEGHTDTEGGIWSQTADTAAHVSDPGAPAGAVVGVLEGATNSRVSTSSSPCSPAVRAKVYVVEPPDQTTPSD
jgi:hypothetical protein